jgi:hypothetical protein
MVGVGVVFIIPVGALEGHIGIFGHQFGVRIEAGVWRLAGLAAGEKNQPRYETYLCYKRLSHIIRFYKGITLLFYFLPSDAACQDIRLN